MAEYKDGDISGIVSKTSPHGFQVDDPRVEGKWFNYVDKEYQKDPYAKPNKGDMIKFHWFQKVGNKSVNVDKILVQSSSEPINGGKPTQQSVAKAVKDANATAPYGYYDIDDYKNTFLERDASIIVQVAQKNAVELVGKLVVAKIEKDPDSITALVQNLTALLAMDIVTNTPLIKTQLKAVRTGEAEKEPEPEPSVTDDFSQASEESFGLESETEDIPF